MKTLTMDPWGSGPEVPASEASTSFEDSFVTAQADVMRLDDSDQYLQRLYSRLRQVQGGTSKKDLVNSLSQVKEDTIARLITSGRRLDPEEEAILGTNPLLRHITPHLQALTASELVHLLKADVLQSSTDEQQEGESAPDDPIPSPTSSN
ncbi:uncharacterized protein LOC107040678 [Diachasma alloeum]|uniref:uncharacterized protein LOC107040678 n=1 Tax=Diachasma alloeum TaxID=454923 RepID=UPI000738166D|nr:uncharacterized protein LOC107040678 [Diachasma alloeum]